MLSVWLALVLVQSLSVPAGVVTKLNRVVLVGVVAGIVVMGAVYFFVITAVGIAAGRIERGQWRSRTAAAKPGVSE